MHLSSFFKITEILRAFIIFLKRVYLFFRERGREGEREGGRHQCVVASPEAPTGDLAHNPGMRPSLAIE